MQFPTRQRERFVEDSRSGLFSTVFLRRWYTFSRAEHWTNTMVTLLRQELLLRIYISLVFFCVVEQTVARSLGPEQSKTKPIPLLSTTSACLNSNGRKRARGGDDVHLSPAR